KRARPVVLCTDGGKDVAARSPPGRRRPTFPSKSQVAPITSLPGDSTLFRMAHALNWYAGWGLILAAFVSGAGIGLFFHRDDFWGGYTSFRRRIVRLGHIALAALGMINLLFAISVPRQNQLTHLAS